MQARPFILTLFGITGDLSQHKLIPALYELFCRGDLPSDFTLIGYGRRDFTEEAFRDFITAALPNSEQTITFTDHWHYIRGTFDADADFASLADTIHRFDPDGMRQHLFYLAVAPEFYVPLTSHLHTANLLCDTKPHSVVLIEKPYGSDEASAVALTDHLHSIVSESQILRIDHFLSKQPVRELPPTPNPATLRAIHILAAENRGIDNRGAYYDATGVIRDMIQNHCLMLLATVLNPKARVDALHSLTITDCVTGHYAGYLAEPHVAPDSRTETFAAITLCSSLPAWQKVHLTIRTGKKLAHKITAITWVTDTDTYTHMIQPAPTTTQTRSDYASVFMHAFTANHASFISDAEVQAAWQVIDPLRASLTHTKPLLYEPGSWGPSEADDLTGRDYAALTDL